MDTKIGILSRDVKQDFPSIQTTGKLRLRENGELKFTLYTLELPALDNKVQKSMIPPGIYEVSVRTSKKFGLHFHIEDVDGRSWILIHVGNYYTDTSGCILVGMTSGTDLNKDGFPDIGQSRQAMNKLLEFAPDGFILEIW